MRFALALAAAGAVLSGAGYAQAAPSVRIRSAVARAVVIPEARSDILVTIVQSSHAFPLKVSRFGPDVYIDGDVRSGMRGCHIRAGRPSVEVRGRGEVAWDDIPRLVIRTPPDVRLVAGDAVFGAMGRSRDVDFVNRGCGGWLIGNVAGRLRVSQSGSGWVRAGAADTADLSVAGSGRVSTRAIARGLTALSTGAGAIEAAGVSGRLEARIAGSGDITVGAGRVTDMAASVAGSGNVRFGGVAGSLRAQVAGAGVVSAAAVNGPVVRRVFGAGKVLAGQPASPFPGSPGR